MTPQALSVVIQAINEVNTKVLVENSQKAKDEGKADGIEEIVKSLRDDVDLELLSKKSGLTIDEIKSL